MNSIKIENYEELQNINFEDYTHVIISSEVALPVKDKFKSFDNFKFNDDYPYNYRSHYSHPSLYSLEMFEKNACQALNNLRIFGKKGGKVVFEQKEESLLMIGAYLASCYYNCRNSFGAEYQDIANIPFPLMRTKSNLCIWACHWFKYEKDEFKNDEVIKFIENTSKKFPPFDGCQFPVSVLQEIDKGVTAFVVKLNGGGGVAVIPDGIEYRFTENEFNFIEVIDVTHSSAEASSEINEVVITVTEFPSNIISGSKQSVKLSCNMFSDEYYVHHMYFLQFLALYYCSCKYDGAALKLKNKTLVDFMVLSGNKLEIMPYGFLFTKTNGNNVDNMDDLLLQIKRKCLEPRGVAKERIEAAKKIILPYKKTTNSYRIEKFDNLKVVFNATAENNFRKLTCENDNEDERIRNFIDNIDQFKEDITSILN
jgi:hypothetical protein